MAVKVRGRKSRWKCARLSCSLRKSRRETEEWKLPSREALSSRKRSALCPCHARSREGPLGGAILAAIPGQLHFLNGVSEAHARDDHADGEGLGGPSAPDSQELERFFGQPEPCPLCLKWAGKSNNLTTSILIAVTATECKCSHNPCLKISFELLKCWRLHSSWFGLSLTTGDEQLKNRLYTEHMRQTRLLRICSPLLSGLPSEMQIRMPFGNEWIPGWFGWLCFLDTPAWVHAGLGVAEVKLLARKHPYLQGRPATDFTQRKVLTGSTFCHLDSGDSQRPQVTLKNKEGAEAWVNAVNKGSLGYTR